MAIEMRCRKNVVARSSPVDCEILLPTHSTNSHPCCPQEPNVSIAIGTKSYDLFKSTYFANFVASADTAAAPATRSVEFRCDGATVSWHVKSHARHFPSPCRTSQDQRSHWPFQQLTVAAGLAVRRHRGPKLIKTTWL